jgi:hypothetical protein
MLEAGEGYQVNPEANSGTFAIADTLDQLPLIEAEANDTIPLAFATGLSSDRNILSISGEIAAHGEGAEAIDASEDVDFYSFELQAGDAVAIDVDSIVYQIVGSQVPQRLDSVLRLFDANGEELSRADNAASDAGTPSDRDAMLTFMVETSGTYYVGIGQTGNTDYDPFTAGSGGGRIDPTNGISTGSYSLNLSISPVIGSLNLRS